MINHQDNMRSKIICGLVLSCIMLTSVLITKSVDSWSSFSEWRIACTKLPHYRDLDRDGQLEHFNSSQNYRFSAFKKIKPEANAVVYNSTQIKPLQTPQFLFDSAEFLAVVQAFLSQSARGLLADSNNWLAAQKPIASFYDVRQFYFKNINVPFVPFVQKLDLPADSRVILRGDLHGDIHSLIGQLTELQSLGYLDKVDGFKISDPNYYMLFLGDYTDRGLYGAEVIYTILRLKLANPDQVFLVRGNHEDFKIANNYGFSTELATKFGQQDFSAIYRIYDFMPVALFLGCQHEFLLCCHGGLEVGYSPQALLAEPGKIKFEQLGTLKRLTFLAACPDLALAFSKNQRFEEYRANFLPLSPSKIGFMWNDFLVVDPSDLPLDIYERSHSYNQSATRAILQYQSDSENSIRGVLRAHQHTCDASNPMMCGLIQSRGVYQLWCPIPAAEILIRSLANGLVWTFNVAPDSVYGQSCNFGFDSFAILKLDTKYTEWTMQIINTMICE